MIESLLKYDRGMSKGTSVAQSRSRSRTVAVAQSQLGIAVAVAVAVASDGVPQGNLWCEH